MSNLARKFQQQQQQQQQQVELTNQDVRKETAQKYWLTPGEKVIGLVFAGLVCFGAVNIISNQAEIYQVNKSIQETQNVINDQKTVNNDLQVKVSDLSNYQRILDKAKKMGLEINENNVKVVPGK
ncbi:cell division protein FtsL [Neobacillus ginsengisoli]|uniref:Cell division protein FtsL n=1 Tax=Neobacillus ginsengisoli TaxID=904295 RepID=A0ABT9XSY8_9BACI|nr:cell division protein FtsL [Neobacillus ginsengisoli]MDQ0198493.1 cell division protein FtsL [Neobacillus ginsengisoli]